MGKNELDSVKIQSYLQSGISNSDRSEFHVYRHTDTHIRLFPLGKENSYFELRTSPKLGYESPEEFLIRSVFQEEFPKEAEFSICWEQLNARNCSKSEFDILRADFHQRISLLPKTSEMVSLKRMKTSTELSWLFVETKNEYHSIFWRKKVSEALRLCA